MYTIGPNLFYKHTIMNARCWVIRQDHRDEPKVEN